MCDYSLHLIASRPARVGDKLISTSFPHTMTRGFASVDDRSTAVCLLPGTELAFEKEIRCETGLFLSWGLGHKLAKFRQIDKGRSNVHHDALEFPDGKTVLLTQLCKGQRATVLQLPARSYSGRRATESFSCRIPGRSKFGRPGRRTTLNSCLGRLHDYLI